MGQMLVREVLLAAGSTLVGGTEGEGHNSLGKDVAETAGLTACGLTITEDSDAVFGMADAIIDFTIASVTESHTTFAKKHATNLILGTTGHDKDQLASIEAAATRIPIVKAMNFSVGVNVLFALTRQLAGMLDDDFDIEIVEMQFVTAIFNDKDGIPVIITSKNAIYNNSNYNTEFFNSVKVIYLSNVLLSEKLDVNFNENIIKIYENVVYEGLQGTIKADNVVLNLITKNMKIFMQTKGEKVEVLSK